MAATPKPVRKHAKGVLSGLKSKYGKVGEGFTKEHAKGIAKAHASKGLVTKKGSLKHQKVEEGLDKSRKMMKSKKK